jgi:hypothetical protein
MRDVSRLPLTRQRSIPLQHTTRSRDRRVITLGIVRLAAARSRLSASLRPLSGLAALTGTAVEPTASTDVMPQLPTRATNRKEESIHA